jgi:peptidoglycan hydrolase-like protein with peptidoglycan-binding domain
MMRKRIWLGYLGAVLLLSAAPAVSGPQNPAQQTPVKKKKTSSSKSKRAPKPTGQKAPTSDRIREIQSALQREGTYQGEPTGRWDDSTAEAMKSYQDKNGLNPTGKIDALSLQKLGLGSATAGKAAPVPAASTATPRPGSSQ